MIRDLIPYLRHRRFQSVAVIGFGFLVALEAAFGFGWTLPCLFRTLLGSRCPGCGLTTAFVSVLAGDLAAAWRANPLVAVVLPGTAWHLWVDFRSWREVCRPDASI